MKSEVVREDRKKWVLGKKTPLREDFENFVPKGGFTTSHNVLCANFVKFG